MELNKNLNDPNQKTRRKFKGWHERAEAYQDQFPVRSILIIPEAQNFGLPRHPLLPNKRC